MQGAMALPVRDMPAEVPIRIRMVAAEEAAQGLLEAMVPQPALPEEGEAEFPLQSLDRP